MKSSWATPSSVATVTPNQRTPGVLAHYPTGGQHLREAEDEDDPSERVRSLITRRAFSVKNVELEIAATPSMKFSILSIRRITPANVTQPSPDVSSTYSLAAGPT
jgi:hypothetical protein